MGDIHGRYDALIDCLKQVSFDKCRDRLIQLGDVCDRGDQSMACVDELLTLSHLVSIRGNHDAWFLEFIETAYHPVCWAHGGHKTAIDYMRLTGRGNLFRKVGEGYKTGLSPEDVPAAHREFFKRQVPYYIDPQNRCFVHGGFNRKIDFFEQRDESLYWDRSLWNDALLCPGMLSTEPMFREIFIGHTPTLYWRKTEPMRAANVFNLDTGAGSGGLLTTMDVETKEWVQSRRFSSSNLSASV